MTAGDLIAQRVADHLGFALSASQRKRLDQVAARLSPGSSADLAVQAVPGSTAFEQLVASVLVGETYWFRDQRQLEAIARLLRDVPPAERRIWSAGCSTGQEAYSLLITLHRAGIWPVELVATDINPAAVEATSA
ncbi:hypothetical protein BH23ACT9_BH23ACT9_40030 [soil metagenome]